MKDVTGAGEPAEVSRQELYDAYVNFYRQMCTEVGPCRDAGLLSQAAQYLLREPEPRGSFTVFPFYQALTEGPDALGADCRKHLCAFIKATEMLETVCVNLFLQPWKKEIRTLKTFTGPFVYCLLPVLSSSTIKSVLASIGYLPHGDTQSEFRLSEDANPDKAMQVCFELLLARVECYHFQELLEKDQLGRQEWLEVLQKRAGHTKPEEPTEKKTSTEAKEEDRTKKEEANKKEVPRYLDSKPAAHPQPKPRNIHRVSLDQSFMEMQITYPDLAFRGRPLVRDKSHQSHSSRNSSKDVQAAGEDREGAELHQRDGVKGTRAAAAAALTGCSENSKAHEALGDNPRSFYDRTSGGKPVQRNTTSSSTDEIEVSDLSGPQAISLHITLRDGSKESLKPKERQPPADSRGWLQHQAAADDQNKNPGKPELPSLVSVDEEQALRELAQRMGQTHENKEEAHNKVSENTTKDKRKRSKKMSTEECTEEQNLRRPVMETCPPLSRDASRCSRSFPPDPAAINKQKQPNGFHPSHADFTSSDCDSCGGGGSKGQRDEDDGEEQPPQSFLV